MAIFTVTSNAVENVDIMISTSFKAGMALMRDDNGRGVPADSQLLVFKTLEQKVGKFLGFATSDHSAYSNTIIIPDVIGSSYIDNSYNYIRTENNEIAVSKRGLVDNLNEGIPNLYNPSDKNVISRRGLAVYNQPNNIFITDQFKPVLHGDYGLDGLDTVALNPGDLLTFGGGVNAGKLVKVNVNSFGPELYIVGIVEKYVPSTNLLHFRQASFSLNFGANNLTMYYDFSNPASYSSGTTVYDLSPNGKNGLIQNGPVYTNSELASYFTFDKSDDVIETNTSASGFDIYNKSFTLVAVCRPNNINGDNMIFGNTGGAGGQDMLHAGFRANSIHFGFFGADSSLSYGAVPNQIYYIVWRWSVGPTSQIFVNGSNTVVSFSQPAYLGLTNIGISRNFNAGSGSFGGRIYMTKIYNRALTNTEVTNMYNLEKSRYGL
jgi:hypothetical protein